MAALEEAYRNSIMVGKYPACILNITLAADTVDVNVHPAKTEIRFAYEKPVFDAVYFAVKNALMNAADDKRSIELEKPKKYEDTADYFRQNPVTVKCEQQTLSATAEVDTQVKQIEAIIKTEPDNPTEVSAEKIYGEKPLRTSSFHSARQEYIA